MYTQVRIFYVLSFLGFLIWFFKGICGVKLNKYDRISGGLEGLNMEKLLFFINPIIFD